MHAINYGAGIRDDEKIDAYYFDQHGKLQIGKHRIEREEANVTSDLERRLANGAPEAGDYESKIFQLNKPRWEELKKKFNPENFVDPNRQRKAKIICERIEARKKVAAANMTATRYAEDQGIRRANQRTIYVDIHTDQAGKLMLIKSSEGFGYTGRERFVFDPAKHELVVARRSMV